jgi:hypothetical protein
MLAGLSNAIDGGGRFGALWCSLMHDSARWPIHGQYECRTCGRRYAVPWAEPQRTVAAGHRNAPVRGFGSALLPILLILALPARPSLAAGTIAPDPAATAAAVLERFVANQEKGGRWPVETIEIEASLPRLNKTGRLRAIRRLLPAGHPDYQVLEAAGDSMVKKQVIVRYVSADEKSIELQASSVAINPQNYKIQYAGEVPLDSGVAYAFRIVPRKKREGLINGVLWVDRETGLAVRESGRLAKSPSIFLKRVHVTRENELRDGAVESSTTHVTIDTRVVGRAQLVIVERPSRAEEPLSGEAAAGQ